MEGLAKKQPTFGLVDECGSPFSDHIQQALYDLTPRLRRDFPTLNDDVVVCEILEEVGRKVVEQETKRGARIERLNAYVWVAVRRMAMSRLRRSSMRLASATLGSEQSEVALATARGRFASAEQIEREILVEEALGHLSDDERDLITLKTLGFSSQEIAATDGEVNSGLTPDVIKRRAAAVDKKFQRAILKIRRIFGVQE